MSLKKFLTNNWSEPSKTCGLLYFNLLGETPEGNSEPFPDEELFSKPIKVGLFFFISKGPLKWFKSLATTNWDYVPNWVFLQFPYCQTQIYGWVFIGYLMKRKTHFSVVTLFWSLACFL